MNRIVAILAACIFSSSLQAQPFGNEWIDYSQKYLEIKVVNEGIFRIDYNALNARITGQVGNLKTINPRQFQLFYKGEEQYIFVNQENDSVSFHSGLGFIEFYGQGNDGWLDAQIYDQPSSQPNPNYSLFNDTAIYYLTWNNSTNNRRMNVLPYSSAGQSSSYFMKEELAMWTGQYIFGERDAFGKSDPEYTEGEGWYSGEFGYPNAGTTISQTLSTPNAYVANNAPSAELEAVFTGISNAFVVSGPNHHVNISFIDAGLSGNPINLANVTYNAYELQKQQINMQPALLGAQETKFFFKTEPGTIPNLSTDKSVGSHVKLRYPHTYNLDGASTMKMFIPTGGNTFINGSNFATTTASYIYDLSGHNKIRTNPGAPAGVIQATIPGSGEKECYLTADNQIQNITAASIKAVANNGSFTDIAALNPDSAYVIITHPSLLSAVGQYAAYRQNDFNVALLNVEELYGQFAYGIYKHPLAIRNFADFALQNWTSKPQYLFLIGKSISERYYRGSPTNYAGNLVPTIGNSATDNLFTAGLDGTLFQTAIPTGRLSAKSVGEVLAYLSKVEEFENQQNEPYTIENKEWMKRVIHFGGGQNVAEQSRFKTFLNNYELSIEDTSFAGRVTTFLKTSSAPVQTTTSDSITTLLKSGVSIMTFFGHAGGNTFDISIDDPSDWENQGKYPLVIANSCFTGDIHQPINQVLSASEEYVLTPAEGAIAYLASPDLGYADRLNTYTSSFYTNLSRNHYGSSLAQLMHETVKGIQNTSDPILKATCLEMSLHGDPALQLYVHEKPDLVLTQDRIFFQPEKISTDLDSFNLGIVVTNIGKGVRKEFGLEVVRHFPNNAPDSIYNYTVTGVPYLDTFMVRLPVDDLNGVGSNAFDISIDRPISLIDEIDNIINNEISIPLQITSNELFPIYPYNFSVVPNDDVTLKASTGDPFAPARDYIIQIDTTDLYQAVSRKETTINQSGGVIEWSPDLTSFGGLDSAVYFWRASPIDPNDPNKRKWREFSFQVIDGKRGWGQDHFFQFKDDRLVFINHNRINRRFDFVPSSRTLTCKILGNLNTSSQTQLNIPEYRLDGVSQEYGTCPGHPAIYIAVIDSLTLEPWGTHFIENSQLGVIEHNPNNSFGNSNDLGGCRNRVEKFFTFSVHSPAQMDSLADLLNNDIPPGNFVLAYTAVRGMFQDTNLWKPHHFQAFQNLGATDITTVGDSIPYIFFAQKGKPSTAIEEVGVTPFDLISISTVLTNNVSFGSVSSPIVGPAKNWNSLHWDQYALEANSADEISLELYGIRISGDEELLTSFSKDTQDILDLDTYIDANIYPYLRLKSDKRDDSTQTAPQLDSWHILYESVPEAAVNPALAYSFKADTLEEGDELRFAVAISNVSDFDMDSLRVRYWVENASHLIIPIEYELQAPLLAGANLIDTIFFPTKGLSGRHVFWVEINPRDSLWQLEQYHFNNTATVVFHVNHDKTNPLLDVTFDGVHILDGDIVSPNPEITIEVDDENQFLLLTDTTSADVFLVYPDRSELRIPYISGTGEEMLQFTPGSLPKNRAQIIFRPNFTQDGTYQLKVQAHDVSSNKAGATEYQISFEVINRSTITEVLNYPNPFTTSTRFVFTLTGSEVPDYFRIQILTVSGKVVREITQDELGPINIGRNVSQYAWDGTDEYGDRLANGVYLYRVITKINGSTIEHRSTNADQYFHRGFGKMYLFR